MAHKRSLLRRACRPTGTRSPASACRAVAAAAAASLLLITLSSFAMPAARAEGGGLGVRAFEMSADGRTVIVRLRSFAPRASGRLEVEPTAGGGRVRLTASNLPLPRTLAPNARTFVAWASGGRIVRLGELRRGSRGAGSLVFQHPTEFARYSLIVTAEADGRAERPTGAPVFSTRANEVAALFPVRDDRREAPLRERRTTTARRDAPPPAATAPSPRPNASGRTTGTTSATPRAATTAAAPTTTTTTALRTRGRARAGDAGSEFFTEIDNALKGGAGARTLTLVGDRGARGARGTARVVLQDGTAYVRVRFRRVPPPGRFGRGRHYAMWALIPEDMATVFMGSLPARNLNRTQTYARTTGVNSDKFRLLVTAERRAANSNAAPPRLQGRRVLMTFKGRRRKR